MSFEISAARRPPRAECTLIETLRIGGAPRRLCQPRDRAGFRSGVGREQELRLAAIPADLCLQSIEAVKLLLRPQIVDQGDAEMAAIKIAAPVQEVDLEDKVGAADRRAIAEAGDPVMPDGSAPLVDAGLDRVDADGRVKIFAEHEVCRRVAEGAPEFQTVLHPPFDLPRPSEQQTGLQRSRRLQMFAHAGRGEDLSLLPDSGREGGDSEAMETP